MAPGAKLVVGKVLDNNGEGSCDAMRNALQWVLRLKNRYKIRILNISVGIGDLKERYKEQVLREELEKLWDHNILVVSHYFAQSEFCIRNNIPDLPAA